jgi:hypothetical protein
MRHHGRDALDPLQQECLEEDLGAVGAVGVPSAVGISHDREAVVDLAVVPLAEQG